MQGTAATWGLMLPSRKGVAAFLWRCPSGLPGIAWESAAEIRKNMCSLIALDPWKIPGVATLSAALARNRQMFRGLLDLNKKEM